MIWENPFLIKNYEGNVSADAFLDLFNISVLDVITEEFFCSTNYISSSPGAGKTTMLRDTICKLSDKFDIPNILVVDEKFEIAGENQNFSLGKNVDIMQGSNKNFAFYNGIKVMNPSVIATDEIIDKSDIDGIKFAIKSGVSVLATVHANSLNELKSKQYFNELVKEKYFERFIVLSKRNGVGTIEGVFDENNFALFLPYLK